MNIKELTKLSNGKELGIEYPLRLYDKDGNEVYYEDYYGYWWKRDYKDGEVVYFEESDGRWWKYEHDKGGNAVYYEDSDGYIEDNREPVDMTLDEVCKLAGRNVRIVE